MQYCYVCQGAGNVTLKLTDKSAVFVCYRCDGDGYIQYPYEIDDKNFQQSEEYSYPDYWLDTID